MVTFFHQRHLAVTVRISHAEAHKKTVQLCRRQKLCTCRTNRVLCCKYHKRIRKRMGHAIYCYLMLFHCFQKR